MKNRQFRALFREFLFRIVDLELLAAQADITKLLGQFASMLAFFSLIVSLGPFFLDARELSPAQLLTRLWSTELFLISTTIVVVGLFAVLSWDSTFLSRRDVLVLAPLPIRARTLFLAKAAASGTALGVTVLALNAFTSLTWPLLFGTGGITGIVRAFVAYWLTMFSAGAFVFCAVLTLQGVAAQLLPRRVFVRVSAVLQIAAFGLFLCAYFLQPSFTTPEALADPAHQFWLRLLPSYWFLGWFHLLNGSMHPAMAPLAKRAGLALLMVVAGALLSFVLSFVRSIRKIVEQPDIVPSRSGFPGWRLPLGRGVSRATAMFGVRTLLRSRQHRSVACFYLGVGFAIVAVYVTSEMADRTMREVPGNLPWAQLNLASLAASVVMLCVCVLGVRVAFALPLELGSNWIFRIMPPRRFALYMNGARRAMIVLAVVPVVSVTAISFLVRWPLRPVLLHLIILTLLGLLVVEAALAGFRKIPFTCSYLPGKSKVHVAFWVCVFLGVPLIDAAVGYERRMLQSFSSCIPAIAVLVIGTAVLRWINHSAAKDRSAGLLFEESPPAAVFVLDLNRDSLPLETQSSGEL
jgi:hypothetical protein